MLIYFLFYQDLNLFTVSIVGFAVFAMFGVFTFGVTLPDYPDESSQNQKIAALILFIIAGVFLAFGTWAFVIFAIALLVFFGKGLVKKILSV